MQGNNSERSRALWARGFAALWAVLVLAVAFSVRPAEAAPFAYVANTNDNTVSVIDTATNLVVGPPIPVGIRPDGVTVTPDGKHVYVTNTGGDPNPGTVSVIDTATNKVVGPPIAVGISPLGIAITPDGKHAYVANCGSLCFSVSSFVSVIDTTTNMVVATVPVGSGPSGIAITPDGQHAYVTNLADDTVSVIDTATNMVEATVGVGQFPVGVAITPDGQHAYVANGEPPGTVSVIATATNKVVGDPIPVGSVPDGVAVTPDGKHAYVVSTTFDNTGTVSVIATATNTVGPTFTVGGAPRGVAVTPDGKHAYVTNSSISTGGTVLVIDTATNTVGPLIAVGNNPTGVGIVPPPPGVPFLAFSAKLEVDLHRKPNKDRFELQSSFTLSSTAPGIHPLTDPVTLQVESFTTTIPPGSFKKHRDGDEGEDEHEHEDRVFSFHGVIDGVRLKAVIKRTGTLRYAFLAKAKGADLTGTKNAVQVSLIIGNNSGTASVKADIDRDREGGDDD